MDEQDYLDYVALPRKLYNEIEENVTDLFVQLGIHSYPVNPMEIAEKLGYELVPFSALKTTAQRMLYWDEFDGISHFDPEKGHFKIYYSPVGTNERIRFTIGHEIGHIRMGHKTESDLAMKIANYYAAYMLAPTPWIGKAECDDYTDLARAFAVSEKCASYSFRRFQNWCRLSGLAQHEMTLLSLLS